MPGPWSFTTNRTTGRRPASWAAGGTLPELVVEIPGEGLMESSFENQVFAELCCAADGSFLVLTHDSYGASVLTRYVLTSE